MEQPQYNMLHREKVEVEFNQIYKNVGLGTTIWSPLASGILSGKYNNGMPESTRLSMDGLEWLKDANLVEEKLQKVREMTKLAKEVGLSMPKFAIAWCLKNPNVSTVILGASKGAQLKETLTTIDDLDKITPEVLEKIEEILDNKPAFPAF